MQKQLKNLLALILVFSLLLSLSGCADPETRKAYRQGNDALEAGRYAEAAGCFGPLGDYRGSLSRMEQIYDEALSLYAGGAYREAAEVFEVLAVFGMGDAEHYAVLSLSQACLRELDAAGAFAALENADPTKDDVRALLSRLEQLCFEGTVLIRPEYVATELAEGRIIPEISNISADRYLDELLYVMNQSAVDSVYRQYRDYCQAAFPESFRNESDSYFTFQIGGATYYVCNYYALYGGLLIKIPRY